MKKLSSPPRPELPQACAGLCSAPRLSPSACLPLPSAPTCPSAALNFPLICHLSCRYSPFPFNSDICFAWTYIIRLSLLQGQPLPPVHLLRFDSGRVRCSLLHPGPPQCPSFFCYINIVFLNYSYMPLLLDYELLLTSVCSSLTYILNCKIWCLWDLNKPSVFAGLLNLAISQIH